MKPWYTYDTPVPLDVIFESNSSDDSYGHVSFWLVDQMQQQQGVILIDFDSFQEFFSYKRINYDIERVKRILTSPGLRMLISGFSVCCKY